MPRSKDQTATLVGLFLFVGFAILGLLVLRFAKLPKGEIDRYTIYAEFADATGILAGSDVRLGGAKVGQVASLPELNEKFDSVTVTLEIYEGIPLPKNAEVTVASSGLLGDKYISLQVPAETDPEKVGYFSPGDTIKGLSAGSLTSLQVKVENLSDKAATALVEFEKVAKNLNVTVEKFNSGVLSDENVKDLRVSIEKLKTTTDNFADASTRLKPLLEKSEKTFDNLDGTLTEARGVFKEIKPITEKVKVGVDRIGNAADSLGSAADEMGKGVKSITTGDGLLPTLINNKSLESDFAALIANTRRHGLLFYKDDAGEPEKNKKDNDKKLRAPQPMFRR